MLHVLWGLVVIHHLFFTSQIPQLLSCENTFFLPSFLLQRSELILWLWYSGTRHCFRRLHHFVRGISLVFTCCLWPLLLLFVFIISFWDHFTPLTTTYLGLQPCSFILCRLTRSLLKLDSWLFRIHILRSPYETLRFLLYVVYWIYSSWLLNSISLLFPLRILLVRFFFFFIIAIDPRVDKLFLVLWGVEFVIEHLILVKVLTPVFV